MAWISMDFSSKALKRPVELEVLLPDSGIAERVVFLLHTAGENRLTWLMKSQLACYSEEMNLCVVLPDGMNSFYVNTHNDYQFMDYICAELPQLLRETYHLPQERTKWMIAGNGMGGYGALYCGLHAQDVFGRIASFNGILDIPGHYEDSQLTDMWNVFGEEEALSASGRLLLPLPDDFADTLPSSILLTCAQSDALYEENCAFCNRLRRSAAPQLIFLTKSGKSDRHFLDASLKCALEWFCANPNFREGFLCQ